MVRKIKLFLVIVLALGGLFWVMAKRAPVKPPPSTTEIWKQEGIPVMFGEVTRGDIQQLTEITGDIDALSKVRLSSKIPGRVVRVLFREGDTVAKGAVFATLEQSDALNTLQQANSGLAQARGGLLQALASLDTANANKSKAMTTVDVTKIRTDAMIAQAQSGLRAAKAQLEVAKQPARSQEKLVAENNVATAKANMDNAKSDLDRNERLFKDGAISASVYDSVKTRYLMAKSSFDSANEQLSMVNEGGRQELIRSAQSAVENAQENLRQAEAGATDNLLRNEDVKTAISMVRSTEVAVNNARSTVKSAEAAVSMAQQALDNTYIKSPIFGKVAARAVDPGQVVSPSVLVGEIVDMGSLYLKGDVSETEVSSLSKGDLVAITIDALPERKFNGIVDAVFPAGSTTNRRFSVRIKVPGADKEVRPGMFARGLIEAGVARNVVRVPKDAIDNRRGSKLVFSVGVNGIAKRHEVQVIREDSQYSQIEASTDLKIGDKIVTMGRQLVQDSSKVAQDKAAK